MFILKYRKIFYSITAVALALSFYFIWHDGLTVGIEFTGGSVLEVEYSGALPDKDQVELVANEVIGGNVSVRSAGDSAYGIRSQFVNEEVKKDLLAKLSFDGAYSPTEKRFSSIGPSVGNELKKKAFFAIGIVVIAIILFIAFAFRKVSKPISSWLFGAVAIVTLLHDIIIPFGVFALLDIFAGAEINILFVTALLAILGYSINDTIVVFDRIRENLHLHPEDSFEKIVGLSLSQTFTRSINTSLTTALTLFALLIWGGEATRFFALVLAIGVISGTYSSIFIASPLLVTVAKWLKKA